jgi:hypothetical protein
MSNYIARRMLATALTAAVGLLVAAAPAAEAPVRRTRVQPSAFAYWFGNAVALDGRTLVVGAKFSGEAGEAFVLERSATDPDLWTEVARLAPEGLNSFDHFGAAVAVSGKTLVAATDSLGANAGAWLYQRNDADGTWAELLELRPDGGPFADPGGVAIAGDLVAVGDTGDNASTGALYLFGRDAGGPNHWGEIAKLVPAGATTFSWFGGSVALSGDTLVAGAVGDAVLGQQSGAAWVFQRVDDPRGWVEVARLSAPDLDLFDRFGSSVDVDGDTIVVGARGKGLSGISTGVAYVYERDLGGTGAWGQAARIDPTDFHRNDDFGASVAVRGDQVLVGAPGDNHPLCSDNPDPDEPPCDTGAAYLFHRNRGGPDAWGLVEKFRAPQGFLLHDTERFGEGVDLDVTSAVVGGPGRSNAYVYRRLFTPLLELSGSCPGTVTLSVSGATPGGVVALFGSAAPGSTILPPGAPCAGTALGLDGAALVATARADPDGAGSVAQAVPADRCGSFLQAVDAASCSAGNVARIPSLPTGELRKD